jgi:hypothetical protein
MQKEEKEMNRVTLYPDGKYRWVYEVSMMKNPSILIDIFKVLGISLGVVWLFTVLLDIFDDDLSLEKLWNLTMVFLGLMLAFVVIGLIAYTILAWSYGWKYVVIFTMDKKELVHQQMPHQVKKAQVLGALAAIVGGATANPGMVGTGVLAASRTTSRSTLVNVKKLTPVRWMNLIKVSQLLQKNRVYVPDEDFDFVYDFLCQNCPNAAYRPKARPKQ